jgi:hypothetical protein
VEPVQQPALLVQQLKVVSQMNRCWQKLKEFSHLPVLIHEIPHLEIA